MTRDQKDFVELTRKAVVAASPVAYPGLCAVRSDDLEAAAELILRFALTNGLTPQEAMPHIETYLSET